MTKCMMRITNYTLEKMKMNREEITNKFNLVENNAGYYLVDEKHPLDLSVGKNSEGLLTLRYNGNFKPSKISSSEVLKVNHFKNSGENNYAIAFSYNSDKNYSLFYSFCEDLINSTSNCNPSDGYKLLVDRYLSWKRMFYSRDKALNEQQVMGLIGELSYLNDFAFKKYGYSKALLGWSGPEPTNKDFSFGENWYEIKTLSSSRDAISISSIEQLDSEYDGELIVYGLQKMSESFDGVSLNKLVKTTLDKLETSADKDLFMYKLEQVGYAFDERYDALVYTVDFVNRYTVGFNFPRIEKNSLPLGINRVRYDISLESIERFKVKDNEL